MLDLIADHALELSFSLQGCLVILSCQITCPGDGAIALFSVHDNRAVHGVPVQMIAATTNQDGEFAVRKLAVFDDFGLMRHRFTTEATEDTEESKGKSKNKLLTTKDTKEKAKSKGKTQGLSDPPAPGASGPSR